ncbi:MAG TPA: glycosyltransferase [Bacteroidales bacterium]|nr:glycosyltransferase [Bacteroidales bacterium]
MKVLFFASDYKIGLSVLLVEQMNYLIKQPDIDFIAVAGEKEQTMGLSQKMDLNRIYLNRINGLDDHSNFLSLAKTLDVLINTNKCEFAHVQNNWQLLLVAYVKYIYRRNFKIIYTIHGFRHNQYFKSLIAKLLISIELLLFADIVFSPSSAVKEKFPLVKHKCMVLFLGVEGKYFFDSSPDFKQSHKNLIFAGQFRPGKNQKMIIRSVNLFIEKTGIRDFTLYLPGEGMLRNDCIKLVENLNLQEIIKFPGQLSREEIFDLYKKCQIAVIPTNYETFGHCIAEPFVMGLCVITRKVGIAKDLIKDGINGLIFVNADDLAVIFEKYLFCNDILETMSKQALKSKDTLHWDNISGDYVGSLKSSCT